MQPSRTAQGLYRCHNFDFPSEVPDAIVPHPRLRVVSHRESTGPGELLLCGVGARMPGETPRRI